jgi:hypothetical protein
MSCHRRPVEGSRMANPYTIQPLVRLADTSTNSLVIPPEAKKQKKAQFSFDFVTEDEDKKILVKKIQADIALLNELRDKLTNVKVPIGIKWESVQFHEIYVDQVVFDASRTDKLTLAISNSRKKQVHSLSDLEDLIPLMKEDVQLFILNEMHTMLQDEFMELGFFNQMLDDWYEKTKNFHKDNMGLSWRVFSPSHSQKPGQHIAFQTATGSGGLIVKEWCVWIKVAEAVMELWMRTK